VRGYRKLIALGLGIGAAMLGNPSAEQADVIKYLVSVYIGGNAVVSLGGTINNALKGRNNRDTGNDSNVAGH